MGLRIYFAGVCTHLWWTETLPAYSKRVVMVNATHGDTIARHPIQPHIPTLRVAAKHIVGMESRLYPGTHDAIVEWKLDGVRVSLENATTPFRRDDTFDCIPSLRNLMQGDISIPSKEAVADEVPARAACIFDVTHGRLQGLATPSGAAFALLETDTAGPALLNITSFIGKERSQLELTPDAEITLANLGATEKDDSEWDFLLHYRLAGEMPTNPRIPDQPPCHVTNVHGKTWPPGFKSVGPGCSNSAYP